MKKIYQQLLLILMVTYFSRVSFAEDSLSAKPVYCEKISKISEINNTYPYPKSFDEMIHLKNGKIISGEIITSFAFNGNMTNNTEILIAAMAGDLTVCFRLESSVQISTGKIYNKYRIVSISK